MEPLTESQIRASFVNCSKGEARRIGLPGRLDGQPWADLDFLGWRDPGAPERGALVTRRGDTPVGVLLRVPQGAKRSFTKTTVCAICLTAHPGSGVSLLAAPRAGASGRQGNTVGTYVCADLACSLYLRGKKQTGLTVRYEEHLGLEERVERALGNLDAFVGKVLAG